MYKVTTILLVENLFPSIVSKVFHTSAEILKLIFLAYLKRLMQKNVGAGIFFLFIAIMLSS